MNESVVYYKYQSGSGTYTTLGDTELETQLDVPYCSEPCGGGSYSTSREQQGVETTWVGVPSSRAHP
jgi:hypothetical protein